MSWRTKPLPTNWSTRIVPRILERDRHVCYRCGGPATEVDHVQPACNGGSDDDSNLAAICTACHRTKSGREARAKTETRRPPEPHPGIIAAT